MNAVESEVRPHIERAISQVLRAVRRLSNTELLLMRAVWEEGDPATRGTAIAMANARVRRTQRSDLVDLARSELNTWTSKVFPQSEIGLGSGWADVQSAFDLGSVRRNALPAVVDALIAVIAADGLSETQRAMLLKPLRTVSHPGFTV